jgi:hypothetical protein
MVANAVEPSSFGAAQHVGKLETVKEVFTKRLSYLDYPELFCFGFLKEFDIPQLQTLATNS